jgi:hypothetical protein
VLRLMLVETALPTSNKGTRRDVRPVPPGGKNSRETILVFALPYREIAEEHHGQMKKADGKRPPHRNVTADPPEGGKFRARDS